MKATDVEARTAVIGVGGAGCNVVGEFYWNLPEVDTIAIDSDLSNIQSDKSIELQSLATDSDNGFRENDIRLEVAELLRGYDMVYVITGLGGRIGTQISPLVVDVATCSGCMVTSIAIKPSVHEAGTLSSIRGSIDALRSICPMTLVVDNELVPGNVDGPTRFGMVNRSIVNYVADHRDRLVSAFAKDLSRNVKSALGKHDRSVPGIFAGIVAN